VTYVVAALVVTNVLTLLNLLLLFGVIRRLREYPAQLAAGLPGPSLLPAGTQVEAFATTDADGRPVHREELPEGTVVGFFSPGCAPCEALLPKFVTHAAGMPGGRESAVAVVTGTPEDVSNYVTQLSPVARVVIEEPAGGVVVRAFEVSAYPAVFQLDGDGRVLASAASLERLVLSAA
jgi:thiol-disulfide isomerase/thioredoxin